MATRTETFVVSWSSGDTNTITISGVLSVSKSGGGVETLYRGVVRGQAYGIGSSGSGPGSTALRVRNNGKTLGLDDRQGAGSDGDFNDLEISCTYGQFYGASGGSAAYIWNAPPKPTVQLYLNGSAQDLSISLGDSVNVVWETISSDLFDPTGSISSSPSLSGLNGGVTANAGITLTTFPIGTTSITFTGTNDGGSTSITRSVTVYALASITSFTISKTNPLQGETVTVTWTTSNAQFINLTPSPANAFPGVNVSNLGVNGSFNFVAGEGGSYSAKLKAVNPVGQFVEQSIFWTVRDETPNAFGWDPKVDVSLLQNENQESNTILINGFGPTQYTNSNLPIKSNYPVQVMVNGDGVWRDVEQI